MVGRLATESFSPPPSPGMTAFDIPASAATPVSLTILYAGLWRQQLDLNTFNTKIAWASLPLGFFDQVWSAIKAPAYTNRFALPSAQRYFKSTRILGPDWLETFVGPLYTGSYPWVYHPQHGWLYTYDQGAYSDSYWFYDQQFGWVYTSPNLYPFLWRAESSSWLYYAEGSSQPRYFYDFTQSTWQTASYSYHLTLTNDLYAKRLPSPTRNSPAFPALRVPTTPCPSKPTSLPA